jgi:hypothetical protein
VEGIGRGRELGRKYEDMKRRGKGGEESMQEKRVGREEGRE